MSVVQV